VNLYLEDDSTIFLYGLGGGGFLVLGKHPIHMLGLMSLAARRDGYNHEYRLDFPRRPR